MNDYNEWFLVALDLPLKSLYNLCQTNKKLSEICQSERFWKFRLSREYPDEEKPDNYTYKEWYEFLIKHIHVVFVFTAHNDEDILHNFYIEMIKAFKNESEAIKFAKKYSVPGTGTEAGWGYSDTIYHADLKNHDELNIGEFLDTIAVSAVEMDI